jgi:hypothetical protein
MSRQSEENRWSKRDRKQDKRKHGMRTDRRPTDIGNAVANRADKAKKERKKDRRK